MDGMEPGAVGVGVGVGGMEEAAECRAAIVGRRRRIDRHAADVQLLGPAPRQCHVDVLVVDHPTRRPSSLGTRAVVVADVVDVDVDVDVVLPGGGDAAAPLGVAIDDGGLAYQRRHVPLHEVGQHRSGGGLHRLGLVLVVDYYIFCCL
jgi:hypothetical protein